eukprot:CAMPEP_0194392294 /NCGR_PEP_ID=MMETSP0174-20130528/120846_1 /TAXON_ID=216777 /ORGANISM="Proboscia alata, Strain PI-D3" /LENGTH=263 /DNA_ID=CAMNT_0039187521 /DNA_START=134 /DNA_END=920 /DNA_ORIENTATION=+
MEIVVGGMVPYSKAPKLNDAANNDSMQSLKLPNDDGLPIWDVMSDIERTVLDEHQNLLLEAPPGAGKTTMVPLALLRHFKENSSKKMNIIMVEPRRVATRSAAQRMSFLLKEGTSSNAVGYIIRGELRISKETQITVMTDGVLLNKLKSKNPLRGVDIVIFDEFHERGVDSDLALALCREIQVQQLSSSEHSEKGNHLKIVVMSATLLGENAADTNHKNNLLEALGGDHNCRIIKSSGRQYPIVMQHASAPSPPLGALLTDRR